jgi:UDP-N-acetylglucosamine 2-epimerase (non-hydrolysing)
MTTTVLCTVGTRPEAIKMAPVIRALRADPAFRCLVLATAQHRTLLDGVLDLFGIVPDVDLDIMQPDQSLSALTGRLMLRLDDVLADLRPDIILGQGDTTTVLTVALAAFYRGIPFGHVEAGLRTGNLASPFPEELNRVLTARMTRWHFAPTDAADAALRAEGYDPGTIHITGNTVIDALAIARGLPAATALPLGPGIRRRLLVTLHRRENFGPPLARICAALDHLIADNADLDLLIPMHPNPNVRGTLIRHFAERARVILTEPLGYAEFIAAMRSATLILSDSGGVQEEAPALGKPVLVLRETTERPEALAAGVTALVGTQTEAIRAAAQHLLDDPVAYARMVTHRSPYGDGMAAGRIVGILRDSIAAGRRAAA